MSPRRFVSCSLRYDFPGGYFRFGLGRENLSEALLWCTLIYCFKGWLNMEIRTFTQADATPVFDLMLKYAKVYPGAVVVPGEYYLSPAFHGGQDVFCAYDGQQLLAYAPVYVQIVDGPIELPHIAWTEIKADPGIPDAGSIKDSLYERIVARAQTITSSYPGRPLCLAFQYLPAETAAIEYVQSQGFAFTESVYTMHRDLSIPLPDLAAPQGIQIRRWKMPTEDEQRLYIAARNECFPEAPITLDEWQFLQHAPGWSEGSSIAAFAGNDLTGCITVYWSDEENAQCGVQAGHTEYIFVLSPWRGNGIAGALICEGMRYLKEHGKVQARLEVRAVNGSALGLYRRLGYEVAGESRFYMKTIE